MTVEDESKLIALLAGDSRQAFDAIYHLYARRMLAFCLSYAKSSAVAEEIVQDVFVQLWNMRHDIRSTVSLKSLLFTIARSRLINAWKATVNSPDYVDYTYCHDLASEKGAAWEIEYDDFKEKVLRIIESLPQNQRKVIVLSRVDGMTNKEISTELGLGEQTVKNLLTMALKTLWLKLGKLLVSFIPVFCCLFSGTFSNFTCLID